jgi:hypothetical protein
MISRGAVISRPVKTGETPPNEWENAAEVRLIEG